MPSRSKSQSTQVPAKIGRPTKYSDEWAKRFCDLIAEGQSVRQICSQPDQPHKSQVYRWLEENHDFRDQYARAREERADRYFEEIIEIAKDSSGDYTLDRNGERVVDHENIQRSRLRVDALKWVASQLAPRKYGDRVEHDHKGGLNFQPAVLIQIGDGAPEEPVEVSGEVIEGE
jgi:terminase small subunit-like protein